MNLTEKFNGSKKDRPDPLNLRLHRALSWLEKAEQSSDDPDIQFITLWISFNAIYAKEIANERTPDRVGFNDFIHHICRLDDDGTLYDIIWQRFSHSIRVMLNNQYVFQPFWDYHNGKISEKAWQEDFQAANKKAFNALKEQDTDRIMLVIFARLYTLRNQIVHGGATYASQVNRQQVKDGCQILLAIIPAIIQIVMQHPDEAWGKPFYPVI